MAIIPFLAWYDSHVYNIKYSDIVYSEYFVKRYENTLNLCMMRFKVSQYSEFGVYYLIIIYIYKQKQKQKQNNKQKEQRHPFIQ